MISQPMNKVSKFPDKIAKLYPKKKNKTVLKDYFPVVWERTEVQNQIAKFKK